MTQELTPEQQELQDLLINVPMKRMLFYTKQFALTQSEIFESEIAQTLIAANEKCFKETGRSDLPRFENMTQLEILRYLGLVPEENEQS